MRQVRNFDGSVIAEYLELEDMPPCRACGCAPVEKATSSGDGSSRLQCPACGIRTGMSTNEQAKYIAWSAAMGPAEEKGGEAHGS